MKKWKRQEDFIGKAFLLLIVWYPVMMWWALMHQPIDLIWSIVWVILTFKIINK